VGSIRKANRTLVFAFDLVFVLSCHPEQREGPASSFDFAFAFDLALQFAQSTNPEGA
jgi:hypothetical protein